MAYGSACGKCGKSTFEPKEISPTGSNYKYIFIQCMSCGVPAGAVDYYNVGSIVSGMAETLKEMDNRLKTMEYNLAVANENIVRLSRR